MFEMFLKRLENYMEAIILFITMLQLVALTITQLQFTQQH